jgi:hypothetical protein
MVITVNGNVGVSDSVLSDSIAAVDTNCKGGVTVEDHNDESKVTVTNSNGEAITAEIVEREGKICENGSGSEENNVNDNDFVIAEGGGELKGCAAEKLVQNEIREEEEEVKVEDQSGVVEKDEIGGAVVADVDERDHELEGVKNRVQEDAGETQRGRRALRVASRC